ncbi:MAG: hypothetical protein WKG00_39460 [Polyangiaceae bacterium]
MASHTRPAGQPSSPSSAHSCTHCVPEPVITQVKPPWQSCAPKHGSPCPPNPAGAQKAP